MAQTTAAIRSQLQSSLFAPNSELGSLIAHVKIWEDVIPPPTDPAAERRKPRYILLAVQRDGKLKLHKSKRNSNATFSIGKTWPLEELQMLQVSDPRSFVITIARRPYRWDTEQEREQIDFLVAIVRSFRVYAGRDLRVDGFEVTEPPGAQPPYIVPGTRPSGRASIASSIGASSQATGSGLGRPPTPGSPGPSGSPRPRPQNPPPLPPAQNMARPHRPSLAGSAHSSHSAYSTSQLASRPTEPPPRTSTPLREQRSFESARSQRPQDVRDMVPPPRQRSRPSTAEERPDTAESSISRGTIGNATRLGDSGGGPATPVSAANAPSLAPALSITPAAARKVQPMTTAKAEVLQQQPLPPPAQTHSRGQPTPSEPLSLSIPERSQARAPSPRSRTRNLDDEDESASTLTNVEEMLEGFDWRSMTGGAADRIEKRLIGELQAHEAASIHAIVESDDRVNFVVKHLDEAIAELEKLDQLISLYRTQLNVVSDDIDHIESQNKGLQVQTSNQRALLGEVESLLSTIHIPEDDVRSLIQESLETDAGIERLERAAASLYKAILSTRGDIAAASELIGDYQHYSASFAKRFSDFLGVAFRVQTEKIVKDKLRGIGQNGLEPHEALEPYFARYEGLMLFVKEMEDQRYQQICGTYFAASSALYRQEISALLTHFKSFVRKASDEEMEAAFSSLGGSPATRSNTIKRAGTMRSPPEPRKGKVASADQMQGSEAFKRALAQIGPHVHHEQEWIVELLHIHGADAYFTFAEYMDLETVFRRGASTQLANNAGRARDVRSSMDLVFGFLPQELSEMIDFTLQKDPLQIVGLLAALDECLAFADGVGNDYLQRLLQRQYQRCIGLLEQSATAAQKDQIKAIEQTKLTVKKRNGVAPFIQVFPNFVERIEAQLIGADKLPIRRSIDSMYDDLVKTMFECLQQMAKMGGDTNDADKDKDALNYHVVLIENGAHFLSTTRDQRAFRPFARQARDIYDENLSLYTTLVLRRPLGKLMDFFAGLEVLLRTTPASEVGLHSAFTKSAARRAVGGMNGKDLRKAVEALAKRVDKHYNDVAKPSAENAQVIATVWTACHDESKRLVNAWRTLLDKCYGDAVVLELAVDDVDGAFARIKPGAV